MTMKINHLNRILLSTGGGSCMGQGVLMITLFPQSPALLCASILFIVTGLLLVIAAYTIRSLYPPAPLELMDKFLWAVVHSYSQDYLSLTQDEMNVPKSAYVKAYFDKDLNRWIITAEPQSK